MASNNLSWELFGVTRVIHNQTSDIMETSCEINNLSWTAGTLQESEKGSSKLYLKKNKHIL